MAAGNTFKRMRSLHPVPSSIMELPSELQTEIFLRLPVRYLLICRSVCKLFNTLIQNPYFANTHVEVTTAANESPQYLIVSSVSSSCTVLASIDGTDIISCKPITPPIPFAGSLHLVGSCNGLICYVVHSKNYQDDQAEKEAEKESVLLLWNPVTTQTRYIRAPDIQGYDHCHCEAMEFYFVPENNDYVVLCMGVSTSGPDQIQVALYKMSTDSWKIVDRISCARSSDVILMTYFYQPKTSVLVNGSFHWGVNTSNTNICFYIVSFNLKNEKLGLIKPVDDDRVLIDEWTWELTVMEESLAVIYWNSCPFDDDDINDEPMIQIWVMKDHGVYDSWFLRFHSPQDLYEPLLGCWNLEPLGCWKNTLMTCERDRLYFYDINTLNEKELIQQSRNCFDYCLDYISRVSSLLVTVAPVRYPDSRDQSLL